MRVAQRPPSLGQRAEPEGATAYAVPVVSLVLILVVTLLWRLPSLFDPPWVNDEGTYFAVGQALSHGFGLYRDVWENKPPAIYFVYGAVYHLFGPSLLAVRLLAALSVLLLAVAVFAITGRWIGGRAPLAAALLTGLLMGVPFLEGTTANAEVFLALFSALAVYLAVVRDAPAPGGVAMGVATLFKAVACFDACAVGVWLLVHRASRTVAYSAGLIAILGALIVVAAVAGVLPAMVRDAFFYDLGYVGAASGGAVPWLALLKFGLLAALTVALRNRPFPYLWLAYAAAGALISGRFFGHYALQAVAPLSVSLVLLYPRLSAGRCLVALPCSFLLVGAICATVGWRLAGTGHDSILARRLQYYANFGRYAAATESYAEYRGQIDDQVNRNLALVSALRRLPPGRLLIWGNTPWIYPLSGRLPATQYTSAVRQPAVPGENAVLRRSVAHGIAEVVILLDPPAPPLGSQTSVALLRLYRRVDRVGTARIYVRVSSASP